MDFANIYAQGFARVAARVLPITPADPAANAAAIIEDVKRLANQGVCLAVYPELCITGATCADLFRQPALLDATEDAIAALAGASSNLLPLVIVGAPVRWLNRVYDCAVVVQGGEVRAVVPKSYPTAGERRWFAPGDDVCDWVPLSGGAPFACNQVIRVSDIPGLVIGVEVGQDMDAPIPPHARMALNGATVLVAIGAQPADTGSDDAQLLSALAEATRCGTAFVYAGAGWGESSTDTAWDGHAFITERDSLLDESVGFTAEPSGVIADVDLRGLTTSRLRDDIIDNNLTTISRDTQHQHYSRFTMTNSNIEIIAASPHSEDGVCPEIPTGDIGLLRPVDRYPFVPVDPRDLERHCERAYQIQVTALARRLSAVGPSSKAVVGVSGGLDSTNALLVAVGAMDYLGRPHSDVLGITLPGFATSDGTKSNAWALMQAVGVTAEELDIRPAARQMLADLGHAEDVYDVTFENVQAGLRTDYLFRAANQRGGLVVGTGDLSEGALGWCTFGVGDHMSHYNVNAGCPKTLIQHQIRWVLGEGMFPGAEAALRAILDQEISPELVPGAALQSSESAVGPYPLNDFFLAHMMAGEAPSRIAYLAWQAWRDVDDGDWPPDCSRVAYDLATIKSWLGRFYGRFFASQFKRSVSVDGPQVLPVSLSPRGGWAMPSDITPAVWLQELAAVPD